VDDTRYAVPFSTFEDGAAFRIGDRELFLYRPRGAEVHHSTLAFEAREGDFVRVGGTWTYRPSGTRFDSDHGVFTATEGRAAQPSGPPRFEGIDTFWYMWSLTHPDTEVLEPISP
jgi:hypothetical protein